MKKIIGYILSILLLLSSMLVAGCSQQINEDWDYDELDPNIDVTISFMHMWSEHSATMTSIVNSFMDEHPNITVNTSITPYDQIEQVLQASYISGTLPNVYVFYTHYMNPLVSASDGVMAGSLNQIYDSIIDEFIQPDSWELGKINDSYYSVPFRATGELLFYNKTIFTENGWEEPSTFEEFEALLDMISAEGTYIPLAAGGKEDQITYLISAMSLFCSVLDGSVDEPGYAVGRLQPNTDNDNTAELIYEKVKNWYENSYFGKGAMAVSKTGAIKEFTSEKAAMVFGNVNNMGDVASLMPNDEIGVFAIPSPSAIANQVKYVFGGYDGLSYNPGADENQKKASIMLIKYLVSQEVQQILADRTQSIVVNKNVVYHDSTYEAFSQEMQYVGAYSNGTDYVTGAHSTGNNSIMSAYIAGTSGKTAKQIIDLINNNVYLDMQDTLLNDPVVDWYPRVNERKTYDRTWLY